jgi:hypothetical protein
MKSRTRYSIQARPRALLNLSKRYYQATSTIHIITPGFQETELLHSRTPGLLTARLGTCSATASALDYPSEIIGASESQVRVRSRINILAQELGWNPILSVNPEVLRLEPLTRPFVGTAEKDALRTGELG